MALIVLIVDDEESIRFTFKTFLTGEGYDVILADTRDAALEFMDAGPLDLIFSDIILPDGSGLDILSHANERRLPCPVVMITGQPAIDTAAESVRMGAYDYLIKPVRKSALLKVTRSALRHKQLLDEKNQITQEKESYRKHLEAIFRSVQDAIITVSHERRVLASNTALKHIFGIEPSDLTGRAIDQVDNPCLKRCIEALTETLEQGIVTRQRQVECRLTDGTRRVLHISGAPLLDLDGTAMGATLVVKDSTRVSDLEDRLREHSHSGSLIGNSPDMVRIYKLISTVADTDATVLICGESGTGKSLLANAIHRQSRRVHKPMMTVHCSALVENLLESELFGHVKGAFTGAVSNKIGRFQACHQGNIFLDEIGEISPKMQLKLLRVLQDKELEQVGDNTTIKVDVRIIAATNRNLKAEVGAGRFREDLFYRLKVVEITMPPLRERREDIPLLASHFCKHFGQRYGKSLNGFTEEVLAAFMAYHWPGNVRELEHAIEHAFVLCPSGPISLKYIPDEIKPSHAEPSMPAKETVEGEAERLADVLRRTDGNKAKAARLLGISRQTLYRRLRRNGIR
jgi:PAS domain S-box-containing protein